MRAVAFTSAWGSIALVLLAVGPAHAYDMQRLAIELNVHRDELPTHACVIHANAGPLQADQMLDPDDHEGPFTLHKYPELDDNGRVLFRVQKGGATRGTLREATSDALSRLADGRDRSPMCGDADCTPRISLPEGPTTRRKLISCTGNPRTTEGSRVLLLHVRLPGDHEGEVHRVALDGSVISLTGRWGARRPTVHVLGGHYFNGDAASAAPDNRVHLEVQTRCVQRWLRLPPIVRRGGEQGPITITLDPTGTRAFPGKKETAQSPEQEQQPVGDTAASRGSTRRPSPGATSGGTDRAGQGSAHGSDVKDAALPAEVAKSSDKGGESATVDAGDTCHRTLCVGDQSTDCVADSTPVMLARGRETRRITATLHLPPDRKAGETSIDLRLEARWDEDVAPNPLNLRLLDTRFAWLERCEFHGTPKQPCPTVDLTEAGLRCEPGVVTGAARKDERRRCVYSCRSEPGAAPFTLPLTLRFTAGHQEDAWRERLSRVGEWLSGFTPESRRQFPLRVHPEALHERLPGDALRTVRVWTPAGTTYEFSIEALKEARRKADSSKTERLVDSQEQSKEPGLNPELIANPPITLAGGFCGTTLRYQYTGTRSFGEDVTEIRDGLVYVPPPRETAVQWTWGALLAPSLAKTFETEDAVQGPPWTPSLIFQVATRWHPRASDGWPPITLEGGLTATLSRSPYYALELPDMLNQPKPQMVATWRFGLEVAAMLPLPDFLTFDDGWGLGFLSGAFLRVPVKAKDGDVVGQALPSGVVGVFGRAPLGKLLWLELAARYFPFEKARRFDGEDFRGRATMLELDTHTLLISAGIRFWK